jgi:hypothetical protein
MRTGNIRATATTLAILMLALFGGLTLVSTPVAADEPNASDIKFEEAGTESDPYHVSNIDELHAVRDNLSAHYELVSDIDATETQNWNSGSGFNPIGTSSNVFDGELEGNYQTITGLYVNRSSTVDVGLFGYTNRSLISNLTIADADITGSDDTGILASTNDDNAVIRRVSTAGDVNGDDDVGGLVGVNLGEIKNSYSLANVSGSEDVGGLVGRYLSGSINRTYATGNVTASLQNAGGLVGRGAPSVTESYWDVNSTGQSSSDGFGSVGLTTNEMQGAAAKTNMSGFDFNNTWEVASGQYPQLRVFDLLSDMTDTDTTDDDGSVTVEPEDDFNVVNPIPIVLGLGIPTLVIISIVGGVVLMRRRF